MESNQSSGFEPKIPNVVSDNYSNVQIVCRIKASQATINSSKAISVSAMKRPNSARCVNFQAYSKPVFRMKEASAGPKKISNLRLNPGLSFNTIQSTPALRSPNFGSQFKSRKADGGYISLRSRMNQINGVNFPSGSPTMAAGSKRKCQSMLKTLSQSGISIASSQQTSGRQRSNIPSTDTASQEAKACVFTTTLERSHKVLVSETPISQRIINDKLRDSSQIPSFMQLCASNGYDANVFDFDKVFSETQQQDNFYSLSVKPVVQSFIEGENGCVLFFGPSQSGKTFSLHGKAGRERGVVPRAIEEILTIVKNSYEHGVDNHLNDSSLIEDFRPSVQPSYSENAVGVGSHSHRLGNSSQIQVYADGGRDYDATIQDRIFIKMSVYMIFCDRIYDLLSAKSAKKNVKIEHYIDQSSQQVVTKFSNMTEKIILSLEQFYVLMQDAFKERKTLSAKLTDHDIRKRSHFVVSLCLVSQSSLGGPMNELSRLNFAELCGSEQSVAQSGQSRDTSVRQFVTNSFNSLSSQLLRSALGKRTQLEDGDAGLISLLKNTLTSKSNVLLVACASPSPQFFDHSLPALKFCGRIRDTIFRKLKRQGFQTSRTQLEESSSIPNQIQPAVMKQTRFNLDSNKERFKLISGSMLNTARVSTRKLTQGLESSNLQASNLKKPNLRKHSRSSSPIFSISDIITLTKQLKGEVQMYDALTREYNGGNKEAVDLDEVREWSIRSLEAVNKAVLSLQKRCDGSEFANKLAKEDCVNSLFYLKDRITNIEKAASQVSPFIICQEDRIIPSNQVSNGTARQANAEASGYKRRDEFIASYSSSDLKTTTGINRDKYRTTPDNESERKQASSNRSGTLSTAPEAPRKNQFLSKYGRELSEKMETEGKLRRQADSRSQQKVPMSARDGERNEDNHSLRNFSRSNSRSRRDHSESHSVQEPVFASTHQEARKEDLIASYRGSENHERDQMRNLTSIRNEPNLQLLQSKFLSSACIQKIMRSTFGQQTHESKALYSNAEETLNDIQRLIMLEDFEGLHKRVVQLFKERQNCDEIIKVKEIEIEELREQLDTRDKTVKYVESLGEKNLESYRQVLREEQMNKEKIEAQQSIMITDLQSTINDQAAELHELRTLRANREEKNEDMVLQFDLSNRLRSELEAKCARLQEENDKMFANYDVLKEHELNIIKDFQDRSKEEKEGFEKQLEGLRQEIQQKNQELNDQKKQIIGMEGELQKQEFETKRIQEQKMLQSDAQGIIQEKLDREKLESDQFREKIKNLESELGRERNLARQENTEKQLAFQEIKQLQDLIKEMEKTIQRLTNELVEVKLVTQDRQDQIRELDSQKRVQEERFVLKDKEMASYITSKEELTQQLAQLQREFDELDTKHVKLRAQEFDKVDVLKVNAELEGKVKNYQMDIESLICERNKLQDQNKELEQNNSALGQGSKQAQTELEFIRKTHEVAMDKFELKFAEFAQELSQLNEQNDYMQEREKKFKRTINKLEVQNLELEERLKYSLQRNTDLNAKVDFVERDMQKLTKQTGEQVQISMQTARKSQRHVDATDRAFCDIKSMITEFKSKRNNSIERYNNQRQSSRSPDTNEAEIMKSKRKEVKIKAGEDKNFNSFKRISND